MVYTHIDGDFGDCLLLFDMDMIYSQRGESERYCWLTPGFQRGQPDKSYPKKPKSPTSVRAPNLDQASPQKEESSASLRHQHCNTHTHMHDTHIYII